MTVAAYLADGYGIDFMGSCSICKGLTWLVSCVWRVLAEVNELTCVSITLLLSVVGPFFMTAAGQNAEVRDFLAQYENLACGGWISLILVVNDEQTLVL